MTSSEQSESFYELCPDDCGKRITVHLDHRTDENGRSLVTLVTATQRQTIRVDAESWSKLSGVLYSVLHP